METLTLTAADVAASAGGEVIHTDDAGVEGAVKMVLDKLAMMPDGNAILGVMR